MNQLEAFKGPRQIPQPEDVAADFYFFVGEGLISGIGRDG